MFGGAVNIQFWVDETQNTAAPEGNLKRAGCLICLFRLEQNTQNKFCSVVTSGPQGGSVIATTLALVCLLAPFNWLG